MYDTVDSNIIFPKGLHWIVFVSVEISRPLTGSEDPAILYDRISSSTLKDAYQDGKWHVVTFFNELLVHSFLWFFLCVLDSNEAQTQGIFHWICGTTTPENHGRRPHRPCVKVGANHVWISFQVCLYYTPDLHIYKILNIYAWGKKR